MNAQRGFARGLAAALSRKRRRTEALAGSLRAYKRPRRSRFGKYRAYRSSLKSRRRFGRRRYGYRRRRLYRKSIKLPTVPRMRQKEWARFAGMRGHTSTSWCRFRTFPDSSAGASNTALFNISRLGAVPATFSATTVYQQAWIHQAAPLGAPTYWNVDASNELQLPIQTRIYMKGIWLTFLLKNVNETQCTVRICVFQLKPQHSLFNNADPNNWWYRNIYQINNTDFRILRRKYIKFNTNIEVGAEHVVRFYLPLNRYWRTFNDNLAGSDDFELPPNEHIYCAVDSNDQTNAANYVDIFAKTQFLYAQVQ